MSTILFLTTIAALLIQARAEYSFNFFKSTDCSSNPFRGLGGLDDGVCLNLSEDTLRRGYAGFCESATDGFINFCQDNRCSRQCSKVKFSSGECLNLKALNLLPSSISPLIGSVLAECN
jgi:hypothetical protein